MKITINKTAKKVLSFVIALAIFVGSLFVANIGVTFNAGAAVVEDSWDGTFTEPTATDANGNIIISNAEEMAWVALRGGEATSGKNYKVVDNAVFNMNGATGVTLNSTAAQVKSATKTANKWNYESDGKAGKFMGNFNGNGAVIYNIRTVSYGYAGLFPFVYNDVTIENVTVKASYFAAYHNSAAIVGSGELQKTITINNCAVVNCYITDEGNTNSACKRAAAAFVAATGNSNVNISNCLGANNLYSATCYEAGFVAVSGDYIPKGISVTNSISIGMTPYSNAKLGGALGGGLTSKLTYSNVYTDADCSLAGVTTLATSDMTGAEAKKNMALDFGTVWFANTSGAPELRLFHNISAVDNADGTHSEVCADCGLIGLTVKHIYNIVDYVTNTSSCICGVSVWGTSDVWDGTQATAFESGSGTKEDPYIIKTAEQLHLMVRSTGLDVNGNKLYYKVEENVTAFYLNETRSFESMDDFVAAAGTLKNWTGDISVEGWDSCGKTHVGGHPYSFSGEFDGNGVTIYGLYSSATASSNAWDSRLPGVGFFTGLTSNIDSDVVVKNVNFDMSYVENKTSRYVGVLTSSFGFAENNDTKTMGVHTEQRYSNNTHVKVANVSSRNIHIVTGDGSTGGAGTNAFAGGIIAASSQPKSLVFSNCLFDGTNATYDMPVASGTAYVGGIYATGTYDEPVNSIDNCVSIEAPVVITEVETGGNSRTMGVINCYTNVSDNVLYDSINITEDFSSYEGMPLLNWVMWEFDDAGYPTPKVNTNDKIMGYVYNTNTYVSPLLQTITTADSVYSGFDWGAMRNNKGVFNAYNTLEGSGTEADPYIIYDAVTLYRVIASGGTHFGMPQHFKLACNIDLGGTQWIEAFKFENTDFGVVFYDYKPFEGIIDGDGHTISNMYSTSVDNSVGFVPELAEGGVIKNLNFRNCYTYSENYAAIIAGYSEDGSEIVDCSVQECIVSVDNGVEHFTYGNATISNCYVVENGEATYPNGKPELDGKNWYGIVGGVVRPVSFAKAQPCADIDGDGVGEEYTASDVTALKNHLLWRDGYDYIYGDVSGNGKTDMRDLAALRREIIGEELTVYDGFWANAKVGNFSIYYDEADNYDFARKLELYLERKTGVDVTKTLGSSSADCTITIKTEGDPNAYSVNYDVDTANLVIKGGSFTAVEEAVNAIVNLNDINDVTKGFSGTISAEKNAVTVNGKTYYYAWGDEFNTPEYDFDDDKVGTVSYDNWVLRSKGTDKTPDTVDSDYEGIRAATNEEAVEINAVSNGKLTLKRGLTGASSGYKYYMSGISTKDSMLFKQGYLEMVATIPSDGAAFPAWWLLTHLNSKGNDVVDDSLYSKVYELNNNFDGTSRIPTGADVRTFKYKLPTQTLEMDLFEIIQRPTIKLGSVYKSTDNNLKFNVHKWYVYSLDKVMYDADGNIAKTEADSVRSTLTVYDLDWSKNLTSGAFPSTLIEATGDAKAENFNSPTKSTIEINEENALTGGINGAATYEGLVNGGTTSNPNPIQKDLTNDIDNTTKQIKELKYGFLWTEDTMTFIIYKDVNSNETLYSYTINVDKMNFQGKESYYNDNYGFNQYAYMLIENHIFTSSKSNTWGRKVLSGIGACDLVIDYVRIYQLDGARAIITPESEALSAR